MLHLLGSITWILRLWRLLAGEPLRISNLFLHICVLLFDLYQIHIKNSSASWHKNNIRGAQDSFRNHEFNKCLKPGSFDYRHLSSSYLQVIVDMQIKILTIIVEKSKTMQKMIIWILPQIFFKMIRMYNNILIILILVTSKIDIANVSSDYWEVRFFRVTLPPDR